MEKLKNPPLIKATTQINHNPSLKIFDNKSIFYEKISKDFPVIIFAEANKLPFLMGDVAFFNNDVGQGIGVNANSFQYGEFNNYYQTFDSYFLKFVENFKKYSET